MSLEAIINPDAPLYEPEIWNDLEEGVHENVANFFQYLRLNHYGIMTSLQAARLLSLGNLVALADDISEYPHTNINISKIKGLLLASDCEIIKQAVVAHFSFQQTRANCYAYAVNFTESYPGSKPDPGGKTKEYKHGLYNDFVKALTNGAEEDGLISAGEQLPHIREGYYRVALSLY